MNVVELVSAVIFGLLGLRSLVYWLRRPMESDSRRDHLLYALFVCSRAGLWFALAGLFLLYASVPTRGRAFVDDVARFKWYVVVLAVLAAAQFLSGFFLGRERATTDAPEEPGPTA